MGRHAGGRRRTVRALRWAAAAAPFLLLALATPSLRDWPPLAAIEAVSLDWRYDLRGPRATSAPVTVVALDDEAVRAQRGWPVPRDVLADAVRRLTEAGAAVIAIDLLMAESAREAGADRALAEALRASGRVILPVAFIFDRPPAAKASGLSPHAIPVLRRPGAPEPPQARSLLAPIEPLAQAAAGLGHVNVVLGPEGSLRQLYPALALDGEALAALPLVALQRFRDLPRGALGLALPDEIRLGAERIPIGPDGRWTINFYGPRGTFPTIPFQSVLDGVAPTEMVRGRIVWIGTTATAIGDTFSTPFGPALPGVEAFATVTANLLEGAFLVRNAWTILAEIAAVLAIGLLTVRAARLQPAWRAILAAPLPLAAWIVMTALAFTAWNLWLNLTLPALAGLAAGGTLIAWRLLLSDGQRRRLASYLPQQLVEPLAGADTPALEGRRQHVAVLFVDLSGFTGRAETGTPDDTVVLLRQLHVAFEDCATSQGGYVDSFAGDGAMLVFGVPEPRADDAVRALACAHDLLERARELRLQIRIGLNCGDVQLARLGGRRQRQFSPAGDTVNIASRLMEIAKSHRATLAVSGAVADVALREGAAERLDGMRQVPDQPVRGRRGRIDVWLKGEDPASR